MKKNRLSIPPSVNPPDVEEVSTCAPRPLAANLFLPLRELLHIKTLIVLIIMQVLAFFVLGVTVVFLPTMLQQKDLYGLSSGLAGIVSGSTIVVAGSIGTIGGGYLADLLSRSNPGARVLVCGIGFLLSAPTFALAVTAQSFALFALFFVITTIFITLYTGPSTAATQDVAPSALRASAVAISLFIAHALGDTFSPTLVRSTDAPLRPHRRNTFCPQSGWSRSGFGHAGYLYTSSSYCWTCGNHWCPLDER